MTKDSRHIDRSELLRLIRQGDIDTESHIKSCDECREAAKLLQMYAVAGAIPLPDAPIGWIEKAQALAVSESVTSKVTRLVARIIFDSWASPSPVGVRGMETTSDRRIRFESEEFSLDLRAEEGATVWAFIAQIRQENGKTAALTADGEQVEANNYGLFEWTATKPTRHITVLMDDKEIKIPELTWKKPMST